MFTIANALSLLAALPELVTLIKDLMTHAQNDMGAGTGPDKKAVVLSGVQAIVGIGFRLWYRKSLRASVQIFIPVPNARVTVASC